MRIAFLTSEYPTEQPDHGGLATYVHRIGRLLQRFGHDPEVFVTSEKKTSTTTSHDGLLVHQIGWTRQSNILSIGFRAGRRLVPSVSWKASIDLLLKSHALARALERRQASAPFDLVQSADYLATGLFVRACPGRIHAVRCSGATDLYSTFDQNISGFTKFQSYMERLTMKRADVSYAPSRYLAGYFERMHGMNVRVIRPPTFRIPERSPLPFDLPGRFFIHFGMLRERKGTALLAEALPLAWKMAPDLTMVWCGSCHDKSKLDRWRSLWGDHARQVQITGPLARTDLYQVLRSAEVAVLPSQVDNLPNTVIESLSLGIPVVGSRGASIDELLEEGVTGHLVELGDVEGLARTLARMWNKQTSVAKGFKWGSEILKEMSHEAAVANLLGLCHQQGLPPNQQPKSQ